jgi:hypothetical protein
VGAKGVAHFDFKSQPPVRNEAVRVFYITFMLLHFGAIRGQVRMYRDFLRSRRPRFPSIYLPKEYFFDGEGGSLPMITDELFQVIEMKVEKTGILVLSVPSTDNVCLPATIRPGSFGDRTTSDGSLAF